jgi:hypothetical protein
VESPVIDAQSRDYVPVDEQLLESPTQQMLAGAFEVFKSTLHDESKLSLAGNQANFEKWEAAHAERMNLTDIILRKGQMGMDNKHFVYRAFF